MSAPRVPAGWTREAADLVWEDWRAALVGGDPSPLCAQSDIDPGLCHALEATGMVSAWTYPHPDRPSELRYIGAWKSALARLRAWSAVGAPVLAPAEDGRPSLAEWVAACEGNALGRPQAWWDETVEPATTAILGFQWGPFPALASGNALGFICAIVPQGTVMINGWQDPSPRTVTTPAELRALLDTLARPA